VEFIDKSSVPAALTASGYIYMGQTICIQPTQSEKNKNQGALTTTYFGPTRLYAGSLPFHVTEDDIRELFEKHGKLDMVDLHKDPETGRSKGFAFIQFRRVDDAKRALAKINGMEFGGRTIKVGYVKDPLAVKKGGADLDDDAQYFSLNGASRAMLMAKLEKAAQVPASSEKPKPVDVPKPILSPCLLLQNMFDVAEETSPNWDEEVKEDVSEECKRFGSIIHCFVDKKSSGNVYIKFGSIPAAQNAINHLSGRWFSKKQIIATFVAEGPYYAMFPEAIA